MNSSSLTGRVAIVTGGARGLGAAVVRAFVDEGVNVVIADVLDEPGGRLAESLGSAAVFHHLDVGDPAAWPAAVEVARERFGGLNILVNNAGIMRLGTIDRMPVEKYLEVIRVNQLGTWLGIKHAVPLMREAGGGSIVNISSTAGLRGGKGLSAYVSSKWAIRGMTKTAALEFAADGIRVNSVHPGTFGTDMTGIAPDADTEPGFWDDFPIARLGRPEEFAQLVLFLASDRSSYSTGAEFLIEGGKLAGY